MRATGVRIVTRVAALVERRDAVALGLHADRVDRAVAGAEAAARASHRARHGGQRDAHPERLLAVIGALQRPAHGDERAPRGHLGRERLDRAALDVADRGRPGGVAPHAVARAREVRLELVPAHAALAQEAPVVRAGGDHRVREAHHQRDVGVRPRRDPAGALVVVDVAAHGADVDEVDAGVARGLLRAARHVPRQSARVDLRVLERQAAERDDQLGVLGDLVPVRGRRVDRVGRAADDVRQDDLHRGAAVAVDRRRVAAVEVEEAVQQALRMMEAARAAPAVGAAVDRCVAVLGLDARELARRQVERLVPADLDERVLPARARRRRPRASRAARPGAGCGPRGSGRAACRCRSATGRDRRRPGAARRPRRRAPRRRSCPSAWTSACDGDER